LIPKTQDAKVIKDFRPISLIGDVYKIITKILANWLSLVILDLISDVQSAFIANRQILDGPFIINELISWCKFKKTKAMMFKGDFKKAFDSVRWDYLDDILNNFCFGVNWRDWIQGCLNSAMGSILVNGSPTSEFKFPKGLKQGDPLSLFLFILVMESLHLSFNNILDASLYKGIQIDDSLTLSHFIVLPRQTRVRDGIKGYPTRHGCKHHVRSAAPPNATISSSPKIYRKENDEQEHQILYRSKSASIAQVRNCLAQNCECGTE
ncbi:RNA-directed DNA polymerase, eukaryota, partial [Tanacetum coccineum]